MRNRNRLLILILLAIILLAGESFGQDRGVPVILTDRAGISWRDYPVVVGVPVPEELSDPSLTPRVLDPWKREVPSQALIAAKWPGTENPRWWQVTFLGSVNRASSSTYTVMFGKERAETPKTSVEVRQADGEVVLDNGRIRVELRSGEALIHKLWIDTSGRRRYTEERMLATSEAGFLGLATEEGVFTTDGDESSVVTVIESGPLKAVARIRGRLSAQDKESGESGFYYDCRLTLFADSPLLNLDLTLTNMRAEEQVNVKEAWLSFKGSDRADNLKAVFGSGADTPASVTLKQGDLAWVEATESKKIRWGGTLSSEAESGKSFKRIGWVDLTGEKEGLTLGLKDFWPLYPKRLTATGQGLIKAELIPETAPIIWDRGVAKTHRFSLYFHRKKDTDFKELMEAVLYQPPLATLPADWYNKSEALSTPLLLETDSHAYSEDLFTAAAILREKSKVDLINLYGTPTLGGEIDSIHWGYFNYGDLKIDFSLPYGPKGVYWNNNYYDLPYILLRQFMQTGDPLFKELAEAAVTHLGDVDLAYPSVADRITPGLEQTQGFRVGDQPEADDFSYLKNRGLLLSYFLFGDRTHLELVLRVADRVCLVDGVNPNEPRTFGLGITAALAGYEATGEEPYLERARQIARELLAWSQRYQGNIPADFIYQVGLAVEGLVHLYHLEKDPALFKEIKTLVDQAILHFWEEDGYIQNMGGLTFTSALTLLFDETGEASYREIAIKQLHSFLDHKAILTPKEVALAYRNLTSIFR